MEAIVPLTVINATLVYLSRCPFGEVEKLVAALRAARPYTEPKPEPEKPADPPKAD